jgi:hypothetical protein
MFTEFREECAWEVVTFKIKEGNGMMMNLREVGCGVGMWIRILSIWLTVVLPVLVFGFYRRSQLTEVDLWEFVLNLLPPLSLLSHVSYLFVLHLL